MEKNKIKSKNKEIDKLTLEIDEKTLKLKKLNEEIKIIEEQYKIVVSTLNEELSKIQDELIQKKAEFETFNFKLENSFITEKDKKIKHLEENIKTLEDKYAEEHKENIKLKQEIQILKNVGINKEDELKISGLEKDKLKMSIITATKAQVKELEKNYKNKEKSNEMNKINNDLNEINLKSSINNEINEVYNNDINFQNNKKTLEQKNNIKNIINDNPIYSYECFNKDNLVLDLREGMEEADIEIQLRNNGNIAWDKDIKLKMVEPSDIKIGDIKLKQQKPNEVGSYIINFKPLNKLKPKVYTTRLAFCSKGKNYGDIIIIKINILDKNEFYRKKNVDEFRKEYDLPSDTYPDEKIYSQLKDNNFSFRDTYSSFFN